MMTEDLAVIAGQIGPTAWPFTPRRPRLDGLTAIVRADAETARTERAMAHVPEPRDVLVERILLTNHPALADRADRSGWTVLHGHRWASGVLASASSHVLLLPAGAILQPLALAHLWARRTYPFVAAVAVRGDGAPLHAGGAFRLPDLTPIAAPAPDADRDRFVPWSALTAFQIDRALWDALGGFDPAGDDHDGALDFGLRALEAGVAPMIATGARVRMHAVPVPEPHRFIDRWLSTGRLYRLLGLVPEAAALTA